MSNDELRSRFTPKPTGMTFDYHRQLWQARFSPAGDYIIAPAYDATVQRWKVTGTEFTMLAPYLGHHGWVQCVAFTPDNHRVLTADSWGQLCCWPLSDDVINPEWSNNEAHDGWIRALAISPDGTLAATAGNDCCIRIWTLIDGKLRTELKQPHKIFSLAFHPIEPMILAGDLRGVIRQWDLMSNSEVRQFDASALYQFHNIQECGGVRHIAVRSDGAQLVCGGQKTPQGGFAQGLPCALVFDWANGGLIQEMQVGTLDDGFAYDACFHPQGFVMACSCAFPGKGHVWFWQPGQDSAFYSSNEIPNGRSLSLHPDGRQLALMVSLSANGNGRVLEDGKYVGGSAKVHILELS